MLILKILFWLSVCAIAHSYLFYPLILELIVIAKRAKKNKRPGNSFNLPTVSILMAAYNEDTIIEKKIHSIFDTSYPISNIEVLVGSDCSTDNTNSILQQLSEKIPGLKIVLFENRQGKVNIINNLSSKTKGSVLIVTDANVLFEKETLPEIICHFEDKSIGLVDTHMKNYGLKSDGISFQEKSYISREVRIKNLEGRAFGTMIGPFGGCYAIRKELFSPVPPTFLVDDFFICMNVLAKGFKAINSLDAIVYEDVSNSLAIEFKRKIRIATGNFQNLIYFRKLLWPPFKPIAFCFTSHKVIRWFGPFLLILALATNATLLSISQFYFWLFLFQLLVTFLPFADLILKKIGIHIVFLRFATHFYTMNLSLLVGFFRSIKGVKSNVWKPTKRFQG